MAKLRFSLGSFIRLCQLDTDQKLRAVERKLSDASGYDYYHSLNKAIRAKLDGQSQDRIDDILLMPRNAAERDYNLAAYKRFEERFGKSKSIEAINSPKVFSIPNANFNIGCDPLFSTIEGGVQWIHTIWAARTPPLQQKYGAVGCFILKECYRNTSLANATFAIADLTNGKRIGEKSITNMTRSILAADVRTISQMLQSD